MFGMVINMVIKLCAVPLAVAVLTFARVAYAVDIDITIPADELQDMRQYQRGRKADEMARKGYVCYREAGSSQCTWAKPEPAPRAPHWGGCYPADDGTKRKRCERVMPNGIAWYYDFERPLVPLKEKMTAALDDDPDAHKPPTIKLAKVFLNKLREAFKRATEQERKMLDKHFGKAADRAFERVDPEGWNAAVEAEKREAAQAGKPKSASPLDTTPAIGTEPESQNTAAPAASEELGLPNTGR